ncbi:MerR family transcriptional regulator [Nocardiopsis valliformis]|uniref:MerR family transcriptional regulator n=1 Tax=Nocardiopsis valliformis TaxID=239974 RepID=UPI001EF9DACC|nr:MerR family transcriptional regulator [Nocardiopsis valliformis]
MDALSPGATARLLGIAPTTLRSWDRRYGVGPRERSPGGHRRYSPADVARLRELCRLVGEGMPAAAAARQVLTARTAAPPMLPEPRSEVRATALGTASPTLQGLTRAAMRMDSDLVESLLQKAVARYGTVLTWEDLAMPLLYGMGRKWEETQRYIEVEHLLSWCVSSVLRRVPGPPPPSGGRERPVVLACVPHEMHSLPVEALAAALREAGLAHRVLGPCTPTEATVRAVRRVGPRAVVLWCHNSGPHDAETLVTTARSTVSAPERTALYTAGPGWRDAGSALRVADGHLGSLTEAVSVLSAIREWHGSAGSTTDGRPC